MMAFPLLLFGGGGGGRQPTTMLKRLYPAWVIYRDEKQNAG